MDSSTSVVSRRDFVKSGPAAIGGVALALNMASRGAGAASPIAAVPQAVLGEPEPRFLAGHRLCLFSEKRVTPDDVSATLHRALELGVNYLDTAPELWPSGNRLRRGEDGAGGARTARQGLSGQQDRRTYYEGTWKLLRQSLKRMQTDRIDLVHLHNFGDEQKWGDRKLVFGERGAISALREAKKQGVVRFIGASGHVHPTRFHEALDSGEIDVLMNAVNFVVRHTYDFEHKVWARAQSLNVGLVAMKVLGGAVNQEAGFRVNEKHYEQAIRYALSVPGIAVAVIGLENISELEKAASVVASAQPLSPQESLDLAKLGLELAGTPEWNLAPDGTPLA